MDKLIITDDPQQTTDIELYQIYVAMTKEQLLKIAKNLDLWVLDPPIEVVTRLAKAELELLDELVKAGANGSASRKMRKTNYMLQKLGLVVTYSDSNKQVWKMFMPDEVRDALSPIYEQFHDMAQKGVKRPSAKDIRFMGLLSDLFGTKGEKY